MILLSLPNFQQFPIFFVDFGQVFVEFISNIDSKLQKFINKCIFNKITDQQHANVQIIY